MTGLRRTFLGGGTTGGGGGGGATDLEGLSDVDLTTPADQDLLTYDDGSGQWIAQAPATQAAVRPTGGGLETVMAHGAAGAAETIDLADGNVHTATLSAVCTLTFTGATNGTSCSFELVLTQDGTGGWTAVWPAGVLWPGGIEPTLSVAAGAVDRLVFETVDGGATWLGNLVGLGYAL